MQKESGEALSALFHEAVMVVFAVLLVLLTYAGLCSSALVLHWVLFPWLIQQQLGALLGKTGESMH